MSEKEAPESAADAGSYEFEVGDSVIRVSKALLDDPRFAYLYGKIKDATVSDDAKMSCLSRLVDLVFGGPDQGYEVMDAFARAKGRNITNEEFFGWLSASIEEAAAKDVQAKN